MNGARWAIVWFGVLVCAASFAAPRVSISVTPRVLLPGASIHLICRVVKDQANRALEWGLAEYRVSRVELDGDSAPSTHEWVIPHVPCDVGPAFCRLRRTDDHDGELATAEVVVSCQRP